MAALITPEIHRVALQDEEGRMSCHVTSLCYFCLKQISRHHPTISSSHPLCAALPCPAYVCNSAQVCTMLQWACGDIMIKTIIKIIIALCIDAELTNDGMEIGWNWLEKNGKQQQK